jgi:hypothetical protein
MGKKKKPNHLVFLKNKNSMKNYTQTLGLLVLMLFFTSANAQKHDKNWLISGSSNTSPSSKISFSNNVLVIDTVFRNMAILKTNLAMSDSLGNLIFYTNGIQINNAQYQLIQNGDSLNPGQVADSNRPVGYPYMENIISIPHPNQANKYYIFHQGVSYNSLLSGFSEKLYYTLIDMNANGGLGRVEQKNQTLLEDDSICGGQLEIVKHGNGRDWWLIQPMGYSNGYHIFLITGNSIMYHHKQYIGNTHLDNSDWLGQAMFSHQGDKYFRHDNKNDLDIFDFDRCSGLLSNYIHIPIQDSVDNMINGSFFTGAAVSPNDRYLYVSSYIYMYQFDLLASNIAASKDTVAIYDNYMFGITPTTFSFLQSGPDGKIYSLVSNTPYLHVIDSPNLGGSSCNVIQRGVNTSFNNTYHPSFPHYRTPALAGSACDTLTSTAEIQKEEKEAILLYPNPSHQLLHVESTIAINKIIVYNALGQAVLTLSSLHQQLVEVNTSELENGTYFMSVFVEDEVVNKQFQVLR